MGDPIGNIRRLDSEGRILIPREIRRALRLTAGDALEVYVHNNEVTLKKYSSLRAILSDAKAHMRTLHSMYGLKTLLCDTQTVLMCAGSEELFKAVGQPLSQEACQALRLDPPYLLKTPGEAFKPVDNVKGYVAGACAPLHVDGSLCGGIFLCVKEGCTPPPEHVTALHYAKSILNLQYRL